jgi:hypothetical protein
MCATRPRTNVPRLLHSEGRKPYLCVRRCRRLLMPRVMHVSYAFRTGVQTCIGVAARFAHA